jgi:hypothetical protein
MIGHCPYCNAKVMGLDGNDVPLYDGTKQRVIMTFSCQTCKKVIACGAVQ